MQPEDRHFLFTATSATMIGRAAGLCQPMWLYLTLYIAKPKPQHKLRVPSFTANSDVSIVHTVSMWGGGGGGGWSTIFKWRPTVLQLLYDVSCGFVTLSKPTPAGVAVPCLSHKMLCLSQQQTQTLTLTSYDCHYVIRSVHNRVAIQGVKRPGRLPPTPI